jgi:uncharacterized protein (DUF1499 family)
VNRASGEETYPRHSVPVREATLRVLTRLRWQPHPVGPDTLTAVWTSPLFRFKDDVSIELVPEGGSTRVLVRSASRVGRYDFGQNARHVRDFFAALERELK